MSGAVSLFTRWGNQRRFNPYFRIAGYEICIDRDGIAVHTPRSSFGFIRRSGFWRAVAK